MKPEEILAKAVQAAHLSGVHTLSQEQFDALFLAARGIGAIKHKHAKDPVGIEAALIQEDIFNLIGIPLNQTYLKEKDKLLVDLQKRKNSAPEKNHAGLDALYKQEIIALRSQYNIDRQIDFAIEQLVEDVDAYQNLKHNFATHLSMSFIEENIDIKQKKAHESDAEFKTKQKLNAEFKNYHALRSGLESALSKIEMDFERKIEKQYVPINSQLQNIEEKRKEAAAQAKKQHNDLMRYYPAAQVRDLNTSALEDLKQTLVSKQKIFQSSPNETIQKEIERLNIEISILTMVERNHEQLALMPKLERLDAVYDMAILEIEAQKRAAEIQFDAQRDALLTPIRPLLAGLEKEKKKAIKQCRLEHKESSDKANQYYDAHILPLVKELKTQEVHKYFVVLSKKMSSFVQDSMSTVNSMDANSIAFIGLMGEYNTDLAILGGVHHVGMKVAQDIVSEAIGTENTEDEGLVQNLLESASKKVGAKIGKAIAKTEDSKNAFAQHVAFMEQHSHVRVPEIVADEFPPQTFTDFYEPIQSVPTDEEAPKSIFDFVEQFNQKQGVLAKASVAYDVYKALTAATPNMIFIEAPNMAQVFLKALEDEALSYSFKMLSEIKTALDILDNNHVLDKMENKAEWLQIRSRIEVLIEMKAGLDEKFQELCRNHTVLREKYTKVEVPFHEAKQALEILKERKQMGHQRLHSLRQTRKLREPELFQKYLPASKRESILKQLETLEKAKEQKLQSLSKEIKTETQEIVKEYDQKLKSTNKKLLNSIQEYDEGTQEAIIDFVKKRYEDEKGFFSALAADKNDLLQFIDTHPDIQMKIAEHKQKRELGKAQLMQQHQINLDRITAIKDNRILALNEKKLSKSEVIEREFERKKAEVTEPFKEIERELAKIDTQILEVEHEIEQHDNDIADQIKIIEQYESELVEISREFHVQIRAFNEQKSALHHSAQGLMNKFFSMNADDEPHLRAMQGMFQGAHMKTKALAKAAKHMPTLVDEASTYTMTYEEVTHKVLDAREVKAVSKTHEERETIEKIKDNVIQLGANSIIEAISGQSVKIVKNIVAGLDATLKAEAALSAAQKDVDKRAAEKAQEMKVRLEDVSCVIPPVESTQKQRGFLSRLWHGIGNLFRSLKEAIVGKPEQQLVQQSMLNEAIVQESHQKQDSLHLVDAAETFAANAAKLNESPRKVFSPHHMHVQEQATSKAKERQSNKRKLPQAGRENHKKMHKPNRPD